MKNEIIVYLATDNTNGITSTYLYFNKPKKRYFKENGKDTKFWTYDGKIVPGSSLLCKELKLSNSKEITKLKLTIEEIKE